MPAATANRPTPQRDGNRLSRPVAANVRCFAGTIACVDANGRFTPGATATTLRARGVFIAEANNTGGAAGAISAEAERGTFRFDNSAAGDAIAAADIGTTCFIVDDQTVAKTNGSSTRSAAGIVIDVDAQGVWVEFR
jgi:hypothetical protein